MWRRISAWQCIVNYHGADYLKKDYLAFEIGLSSQRFHRLRKRDRLADSCRGYNEKQENRVFEGFRLSVLLFGPGCRVTRGNM